MMWLTAALTLFFGFWLGRLTRNPVFFRVATALEPKGAPDLPLASGNFSEAPQTGPWRITMDDAFFTSLIPDRTRQGIIATSRTGERYLIVGTAWNIWPSCEPVEYWVANKLHDRLRSQLLRAALPIESVRGFTQYLNEHGSVLFEDSSDHIESTGYRSTAAARPTQDP